MISNLSPSGEAFMANMTRVQRNMERATREASSGLRVNSASDAPDDVTTILQLRTDALRNKQIGTNLALAKTDADAADAALNSATKLLDRARSLGAQGANFTQDAGGRQSLAGEVQALLEQMVSISRTSVQGRYIFSGDDEDTAPYQLDLTSATGVTRMTTAGATRRLEDPAGGTFAVSKTAGEIFDARNPDDSPSSSNVFAALNSLRVALLNNDVTAITTAMGAVQNAGNHLGNSQGFYGSVLGRIQDATNFSQSYDVQLRAELSQKVDADVTEAAMTLTQTSTQLQAAFQMQARMPHTSLFDFLG
jgi:flagellar hook-associated protein 3 FlgL